MWHKNSQKEQSFSKGQTTYKLNHNLLGKQRLLPKAEKKVRGQGHFR